MAAKLIARQLHNIGKQQTIVVEQLLLTDEVEQILATL
jgi:hypothetical protein